MKRTGTSSWFSASTYPEEHAGGAAQTTAYYSHTSSNPSNPFQSSRSVSTSSNTAHTSYRYSTQPVAVSQGRATISSVTTPSIASSSAMPYTTVWSISPPREDVEAEIFGSPSESKLPSTASRIRSPSGTSSRGTAALAASLSYGDAALRAAMPDPYPVETGISSAYSTVPSFQSGQGYTPSQSNPYQFRPELGLTALYAVTAYPSSQRPQQSSLDDDESSNDDESNDGTFEGGESSYEDDESFYAPPSKAVFPDDQQYRPTGLSFTAPSTSGKGGGSGLYDEELGSRLYDEELDSEFYDVALHSERESKRKTQPTRPSGIGSFFSGWGTTSSKKVSHESERIPGWGTTSSKKTSHETKRPANVKTVKATGLTAIEEKILRRGVKNGSLSLIGLLLAASRKKGDLDTDNTLPTLQTILKEQHFAAYEGCQDIPWALLRAITSAVQIYTNPVKKSSAKKGSLVPQCNSTKFTISRHGDEGRERANNFLYTYNSCFNEQERRQLLFRYLLFADGGDFKGSFRTILQAQINTECGLAISDFGPTVNLQAVAQYLVKIDVTQKPTLQTEPRGSEFIL